ncbi:uncharacterized protein LOC144634499 isoform X2 [Oculina patagonica]
MVHAVNMSAAFRGQPTRGEIRRNERKGERGVCRIQKRCEGRQGYETVGSGILIKHQFRPQLKSKYLIVTTSKVFQNDFDVTKYRVDFVKSRSKLKRFELDGAVVDGDILQNFSGLAVILLDSHSSVFRHGLFRKKCGILKHRPFEVESFDNEKTKLSTFSNGLCCHMVADDPSSELFGVKPHDLTRDSSSGQLVVSNLPSGRVPLGAGNLRRVGNKWSAVGILSSTSDTFVPVWLSRENFSKTSNFRTEVTITSSEVDAVVYSEQSNTVESLQTAPADSVVSPVLNENQTGDRENSTILDQSTNGLHVSQEQRLSRDVVNLSSSEEEQNEPHTPEVNTLNGGIHVQAGVSSKFRSETNNGQVLYIGDVVDNVTLMDELAQCLDREYRVIKHWKHLAYELNIPHDVQTGFEIYFELSPTVHLFQFLSTNDPHLTVGKLRLALKDIHRNDLIQELKDFSETAVVVDVFDNKPSLLDDIALKLDSAKRPVGNWRNLAVKLNLTGQSLKEFEAQLHSSENPTALLFRYLRSTEKFRQLTVGDLKGHLENLSRKDVLKVLADVQDSELLADTFSPDSDLLNSVSTLLNKKSPGVRNWRNLANKLGVPSKVYQEFDPVGDRPRPRPTKMMLEWLRSERPDMTVDELRTAVKKIDRADALEILDGYLFNSQGTRNEASSSGEQFVSLESTPNEQKRKTEAKSLLTESDEVDIGLHSHPVPDLSPSKNQQEARLMTAVTAIPYRVHAKICVKLNIRRLLFDDFRMLGEKVGLTRDEVEYLGQQDNPTDHILKKWSSTGQATVKKFMDVLSEEGLERHDVIEILKNWVDQ